MHQSLHYDNVTQYIYNYEQTIVIRVWYIITFLAMLIKDIGLSCL